MNLAELVGAAARGDQGAWNEIVERFQRLVWATARAHRLSPADAADVAQTTWLRLVENLDRIRDPEHLGAWLATTARRESIRQRRLGARELPTDLADAPEVSFDDSPELRLLRSEREVKLWRAFVRLSERCQALLRLLFVSDAEPTYEEIGEALGMPVGAIGPTRMRCIDKLRVLTDSDPVLRSGTE
jgi:RNA polymerase sigma factor (sigma-70 family)